MATVRAVASPIMEGTAPPNPAPAALAGSVVPSPPAASDPAVTWAWATGIAIPAVKAKTRAKVADLTRTFFISEFLP